MIKKPILPILMSLIILLIMASCSTAGTPISATSMPTAVPLTATVPASATPIPPTETATAIPFTVTPTTTPMVVIEHFPIGQEFNVITIHMIDANIGWAIGGLEKVGNHVLYTSDGGSTWKDITPPEAVSGEEKVATGFFQDAQTAWVTYAISGGIHTPTQAVVWRTQDGGQTWQASQPLDLTGLSEIYVPSDLQFVAGLSGWLLVHVGVGMNHDYVVLYRSTDGGTSWSRILDPYNDGGIQSCEKTRMLFTDATHGWLTGDCHGVKAGVLLYNSTDGGSTWQEVTLPAPASDPTLFSDVNFSCGSYDPFFFGNDLGHLSVQCANYGATLVTPSYYIYTTQNGGITWTEVSFPGIGLYFFSADTGWAITQEIQRTTDSGATWTLVSNVTWNAALDFISEQIGWGVAWSHGQVALVKTTNGGGTWTMLSPTVGP